MNGQSLYRKVVLITAPYLGPAADRFITRHIVNHLHKSPEKLTATDIRKLIDWIKPAMSLLTEDTLLVDSYINKLYELSADSRNEYARKR